MTWTTAFSADSLATPDQVWRAYTDVARWPEWDLGVTRCTLDGPFQAGTRGTLKPKGGPALGYVITAAEPRRGFSDRTPMPHALLPLAVVHLTHELVPLDNGGTRITHRVRFSGLLGRLAARLMAPGFDKDLPDSVRSLAAYAASRDVVANAGDLIGKTSASGCNTDGLVHAR